MGHNRTLTRYKTDPQCFAHVAHIRFVTGPITTIVRPKSELALSHEQITHWSMHVSVIATLPNQFYLHKIFLNNVDARCDRTSNLTDGRGLRFLVHVNIISHSYYMIMTGYT